MKKIILALFFGVFFFGTVHGLVVKQVDYNPENGRIVALVFNNLDAPVEGFSAVFFADGKQIGVSGMDNFSVPPRSTVTVFFEFPFDGKEHEFTVHVFEENEPLEQVPLSQKSSDTSKTVLITDGVVPMVIIAALVVGAVFLLGWMFLKKTILSSGGENQ